MARFFDFDKAWEERAAEQGAVDPVQVKMFGELWDLPVRLPAAVILRGARLMEGGDRVLSDRELIVLAADLVPGNVLDAWFARGIDMVQLADVLRELLPVYMGADGADPGEAEARGKPAANGSSGRSSKGGRRSRRTSPASTAATSTG